MSDTPTPSPRPERRRLLRCDECWQTFECTAGEAVRFARAGWPTCCDRPMALFAGSAPPSPDDPTVPVDPGVLFGPSVRVMARTALDLAVRILPPAPREPGPGGVPAVRVAWAVRKSDGTAFASGAVATPADDARAVWVGLGRAADWLIRLAVPIGSLAFEMPEPAAAGRLLVAVAGPDNPSDPYLRRAAALVHRLGCTYSVRSYHPCEAAPARIPVPQLP